jgi:hypothetical protein
MIGKFLTIFRIRYIHEGVPLFSVKQERRRFPLEVDATVRQTMLRNKINNY